MKIANNAKIAKKSKLGWDIEMVDAQMSMFGNFGISGDLLFPVTR
jgi:hypothetical protein